MTESEWLACTDPQEMLEVVYRGPAQRKVRLYACACCRRIWHLLIGERSRQSVEVAERYVDGQADEDELRRADDAPSWLDTVGTLEKPDDDSLVGAADASYQAACGSVGSAAWLAATAAAEDAARGVGGDAERWVVREAAWTAERQAQAALLQDIFGNPFRPVAVEPSWLAWHGGAAVQLAAAVYERRELPSGHLDAARLAVLADMLEEAGCTDAGVLGHLRSPGPHVRGCFAVDALLGKA